MNKIHWRFGDRFRSHWIKVKFYKEKPKLKEARRFNNVRFCEATREAVLGPVLLEKKDISCLGAQCAFGWINSAEEKSKFLNYCQDKRKVNKIILDSILAHTPCFDDPFEFIGLNTEGEPDLVMSYILPQDAMNILKIYDNHQGSNLDISLSSMMPICAGIATRTYREQEISFSFGCDDARKFTQIGRDRLAVGIPRKLFDVFAF